MNTPPQRNQMPRVIALIIVSILGALWMINIDASALAKLDSMSAADYIQRQRELHQHNFIFHFIVVLFMGGFYLGVVDFISYLIGLFFSQKPEV
jgi:hypothetical protein